MTLEAIAKIPWYAAVLIVLGTTTAYWLVLEHVSQVHADQGVAVDHGLHRIGAVAAAVAVLAVALRLWAHTAGAFGVTASLAPNSLSTVAITSRWGHRWRWQVLAALSCLALFAPGGRRLAWLATAVACVGLAVSAALTGHAAAVPMRAALHAAHVMGGGMWLGTLATLMLVRRAHEAYSRVLFGAFSAVAMVGAAVVVLTGATASYIYVGALTNLWATTYGRVLVLKVVLAFVALGCGLLNWRTIHVQGNEPGRAAAIELAVACSIVVVTSLLTELEHP